MPCQRCFHNRHECATHTHTLSTCLLCHNPPIDVRVCVYVGYMSNVCSMLVFHLQDHKLKHMAELQQSVVTDQETRHQIQSQILQWEENLERLHCEQFRLRCYMASLQSGELPNPKVSNMFPTPTPPPPTWSNCSNLLEPTEVGSRRRTGGKFTLCGVEIASI